MGEKPPPKPIPAQDFQDQKPLPEVFTNEQLNDVTQNQNKNGVCGYTAQNHVQYFFDV